MKYYHSLALLIEKLICINKPFCSIKAFIMRSFAINPQDFTTSRGKIEYNSIGEPAFTPVELPETIEFSSELVNLLSSADRKLGELCGVVEQLPRPELITASFVRRESVFSSRIEGTHASLSDVLKAEVESVQKSRDAIETSNAVNAVFFGLDNTQMEIVPLAKKMHEVLFAGIETYGIKGEFRTQQNFIGSTSRIEDARYVPPMPEKIPQLMASFQEYFDKNHQLPPLVKAALLHYQFETIHPFIDGNGRIGRSLITLFLLRKKILTRHVLFLSEYFYKYHGEYEDRLLNANKTGDFNPWLKFFLVAVIEQSQAAIEITTKLVSLKERYKSQLKESRTPAGVYLVLDELFVNPFVTIPYLAHKLGGSFPTIQRIVEVYLTRINAVKEITGNRRNRVFCASEILSILDPTTKSQ